LRTVNATARTTASYPVPRSSSRKNWPWCLGRRSVGHQCRPVFAVAVLNSTMCAGVVRPKLLILSMRICTVTWGSKHSTNPKHPHRLGRARTRPAPHRPLRPPDHRRRTEHQPHRTPAARPPAAPNTSRTEHQPHRTPAAPNTSRTEHQPHGHHEEPNLGRGI
jgi:hypothetical protein